MLQVRCQRVRGGQRSNRRGQEKSLKWSIRGKGGFCKIGSMWFWMNRSRGTGFDHRSLSLSKMSPNVIFSPNAASHSSEMPDCQIWPLSFPMSPNVMFHRIECPIEMTDCQCLKMSLFAASLYSNEPHLNAKFYLVSPQLITLSGSAIALPCMLNVNHSTKHSMDRNLDSGAKSCEECKLQISSPYTPFILLILPAARPLNATYCTTKWSQPDTM